MKKKIMLAIIAIAASLKVSAQIQFSEFKFFVANIYDFSQLQLEVKFKVTSERNLKYVNVHFYLRSNEQNFSIQVLLFHYLILSH